MKVRTSPPAKLNLFLEIPAKREDGFHEIDTVMTAIDLCDELSVESIEEPVVELSAHWLPSLETIASELAIDPQSAEAKQLLAIPEDGRNLVVAALQAFRKRFQIESGFRVELGKRIPAGAGMGGASSDAAHAISCAAQIHQFSSDHDGLHEIAASIGSDVPFFLPLPPVSQIASASTNGETTRRPRACHASGRGEILQPVDMRTDLFFVVGYPPASLATKDVYGRLRVPAEPISSKGFLASLRANSLEDLTSLMINRLSEPALEIRPELSELLESLWKSGLQPCQLTGSGSACFGIARDAEFAQTALKQLRANQSVPALWRATRSVAAAATIEIDPS
ncbi:4-(cytidine 5'-diphospho)-2-C-methyl-D-erythritol kinase [Roseiconus lacunae]|uniref:4-diphosphocytidyl-2-C-methyl-D-erythritol kinase n=1 Tax=Roseiconus lacunae TaxID=2605694 RepID=A0ABT7PG95_9BACT|nr:4-(cytidine 5'-diphospho)-2-C-methyl-D-erythritol kinase [Roseiconus lacunae]MCD0460448.1 4-(cytidine 5'-diphospho)-2-C-methyl-D-erythritol kinase [Roseiconus lacunae]MDM4015505.1 4-(cytidine 5'-diphospho)-2-C-methyl-D-erythritol kinase [Roseiconus lacunae]